VGFVLVRGAHPDDPRSRPPLAAKGDLDAQRPQRSLNMIASERERWRGI
jgi:hypothetical protein